MSTEYEEMDSPIDGETAVEPVQEEKPVETPVDPPAEEASEEVPEETPEQIEEKKRLSGSARQKAKAERLAAENQALKERLDRLEAKVDPQAKAQATHDNGAPSQDQFETHAEWVEALTDWKLDLRLKEREAREQTAKVVQSWEQKKAAAREELPDLDEVLADMEPPAPVVVAVMAESDHAAKIAYHLAQHPDELRKINQMSPPAAALAVARIEASLTAPKPTPKRTTQAPPPISPVVSSGVAATPTIHARFEEF